MMASRPYVDDRFGILNPWGDVWTPDTFDTEEAAREHLRDFWSQPGFGRKYQDVTRFKVVPVTVRVEIAETTRALETAPPQSGSTEG